MADGYGDSVFNRISFFPELCHGSKTVQIVRMFLDSGALRRFAQQTYPSNAILRFQPFGLRMFFVVLACSMSLGCTLPEGITKHCAHNFDDAFVAEMNKQDPKYALTTLAFTQLKEAYFAYTPGIPANCGNETMLETLYKKTMLRANITVPPAVLTVTTFGTCKVFKTTLPPMTVTSGPPNDEYPEGQPCLLPYGANVGTDILGPPGDDDLGIQPVWLMHLCAACGQEKKRDGTPLDVCKGCGKRKFCSELCEKRHWNIHKVVCEYPKEEMKKFLDSVPINFKGDVHSHKLAMKMARG